MVDNCWGGVAYIHIYTYVYIYISIYVYILVYMYIYIYVYFFFSLSLSRSLLVGGLVWVWEVVRRAESIPNPGSRDRSLVSVPPYAF